MGVGVVVRGGWVGLGADGEQVASVDKDGTTVTQITLTNGTTVAARVFVEASYEADLIARAGVSYIVGR